jgi:hypothetical protein
MRTCDEEEAKIMAIHSRHLSLKPLAFSMSKRYGHESESKALAKSSFRRMAGFFVYERTWQCSGHIGSFPGCTDV